MKGPERFTTEGEEDVAEHGDSSRPSPVSTWVVLRALGFSEDQSVISDRRPGLSFDFGNFKLSAGCMVNQSLVPIVQLSGVMSMGRSIADVEAELPLEVESEEQGMAFVAWCLDTAAHGRFQPALDAPAWLEKGRQHRDLLPWERKRTKYKAHPHCSVHRDWLRVALKRLAEKLSTVNDDEPVTFEFDGRVLTIRCADSFNAMPAEGQAWPEPYSIRAGAMTELPKRLTRQIVAVSVSNSGITIGNRRYSTAASSAITRNDKPA